jgi:hypothetical protein
MSSLVYLGRLQARLPPVAKGMRCTVHRIFLASLILAAKNLNDSSPKNKHWARYTAVKGYEGFGFSLPEVNLMERQLLFLLDWETRVTEEDLFTHLEPFLAPIRQRMQLQHREKMAQEEQQRKQQQHREWYEYIIPLPNQNDLLTFSPGDVYMHRRICWPVACVVKSLKLEAIVVVLSIHLCADFLAMFHVPISRTKTTHPNSSLSMIATLLTTVTVPLPTDLGDLSHLPLSAMFPLSRMPRLSTPFALDHPVLLLAPAEPQLA